MTILYHCPRLSVKQFSPTALGRIVHVYRIAQKQKY